MKEKIHSLLSDSVSLKEKVLKDPVLVEKTAKAIGIITDAFRQGSKVLFCGNGGSAADSQHLAAEFSGRFYKNRRALPAEALHCNTSYLTAVANDYHFDEIYARLLDGIGFKGDVLIGMSTSGNSTNVAKAFEVAKEKGIVTIGMTGEGGGRLKDLSDILLDIPSKTTPRIQECHMLLGHIICELVEADIFP